MTDTLDSWQWAIDKLRQETHCTASVNWTPSRVSDDAYMVNIEEPDGKPLLKATCYGAHIAQFLIEAVRVAYMEDIA